MLCVHYITTSRVPYHVCHSITVSYSGTRYRQLWGMTIAGPPRCPVWCHLYGTVYQRKQPRMSRLVTVATDPFTGPTAPFLLEWAKCPPGNTQNVGAILPIMNLMADLNWEARIPL